MTNTRFAMIDINSGYVWGVETAANAVAACAQMDQAIGGVTRAYDEHGPRSYAERRGQSGYIVHAVPAEFDVDDGQDAAQIAAVGSYPCVAIVLVSDASEALVATLQAEG